MEPSRRMARGLLGLRDRIWPDADRNDWVRRFHALCDSYALASVISTRPPFAIKAVPVGNQMVPVREEVVQSLPFGNLVHFAKDDLDTPQPKMLVVAPLSGHFATLLHHTVEVLLRDHDVYITDWRHAREVPVGEGAFGLDDYIDYIIAFLRHLGPNSHLLAVCQPCVPALAAVAVMAGTRDPCQPRTMTLMGGPIDVREAPTVVNDLARQHSLDWFEANLISQVPARYAGAGRRVYPGFLQLHAFMSMNMGRHLEQFRRFYQALADARISDADKIRDFYVEYFSVLDLTAEFYLETIDRVFQRALLAKGELDHRGVRVDCGAIRHTALLTVEGERDDICGVGQTAAAHLLCTSLRPHLKRHHLQPGVGHYGVFSGSKWEKQIYPQVRNLVLAMS
ncbi:polyhydroxyalkanoate depolymerase [Novosphingobium sp. FSW06-99]|uniref:polyhydroxyalkanoate depolymerase n=1 Tax=Novosphingobium sp. FSW06-99 TaxID=1739113 RepID=UPI00076D9303|nr:polyhydroxyalkanoate depolymerase [Novosphingobium sp. FSW06-99]KUR77793.1 poly(3-hydroxybutyrate) depolymerase [Novosphingobium sp. FSW06-99]